MLKFSTYSAGLRQWCILKVSEPEVHHCGEFVIYSLPHYLPELPYPFLSLPLPYPTPQSGTHPTPPPHHAMPCHATPRHPPITRRATPRQPTPSHSFHPPRTIPPHNHIPYHHIPFHIVIITIPYHSIPFHTSFTLHPPPVPLAHQGLTPPIPPDSTLPLPTKPYHTLLNHYLPKLTQLLPYPTLLHPSVATLPYHTFPY